MSQKRDYYEVLGVDHKVSDSDIKKAFRSKAREFHPDKNPDDPDAEARFNEVQEAYAILSNPDERKKYDMFGHDRPGGSPWGAGGFQGVNISIDDLFSGGFESIFSSLFGGGTRQRPSRGADLLIRHVVSFQDAFNGVDDELEIECEQCCEINNWSI